MARKHENTMKPSDTVREYLHQARKIVFDSDPKQILCSPELEQIIIEIAKLLQLEHHRKDKEGK